MSKAVRHYLEHRRIRGPWRLEGSPREGVRALVVIPALAEEGSLFESLEGLARNPASRLDDCLVMVVVNQRASAPRELKEDNRRTLDRLRQEACGLHLAWVDACSEALELPEGEGVGLARRIGMDLGLARLDFSRDPFLVCLDADTWVDTAYLPALFAHFDGHRQGGAVIPFAHRAGSDPALDHAILRYELFLRHYVLGLELAGSPWAFHCLGSALACRLEAYCAVGGMVRREAGEDFYFLQKLAKSCGMAQVKGTCVAPSPRASNRTPFGTGASLGRLLSGEAQAVRFYPAQSFGILERWLRLCAEGQQAGADELMEEARRITSPLARYLREAKFEAAWENLRRNHPDSRRRREAFHGWFDGFRTLKLIHRLCDEELGRCGPEQAMPPLLRRAGIEEGADPQDWLQALRAVQNS